MKPPPPNAPPFMALSPVTPVSWPAAVHRCATDHFFPFQRSTYCPSWLVAQMSPLDGALASLITLVSPAGSAATLQRAPFQCAATGDLGRARLPDPKAQASVLPGATTARYPL